MKHGTRRRSGKEAGMNPITTYCSRGDSHPAAATRLNTCLRVWLVNNQQKMRQKKKERFIVQTGQHPIRARLQLLFYLKMIHTTLLWLAGFIFNHSNERENAVICFFRCFCVLFSLFHWIVIEKWGTQKWFWFDQFQNKSPLAALANYVKED